MYIHYTHTGGMLLLLGHMQFMLQLSAGREAVDKHAHDVHVVPALCGLSLLCYAVS